MLVPIPACAQRRRPLCCLHGTWHFPVCVRVFVCMLLNVLLIRVQRFYRPSLAAPRLWARQWRCQQGAQPAAALYPSLQMCHQAQAGACLPAWAPR